MNVNVRYQVGVVAKVEAEALQLIESLQNRMRAVGRQVAGAKRPKVLSLEGLQPLVLGMHLAVAML